HPTSTLFPYTTLFRSRILAKHIMTLQDYQTYNANYIGGDITGGVMDLGQLFARPISLLNPYATPICRLLICSSSTPPGGGVHGIDRKSTRLNSSHVKT